MTTRTQKATFLFATIGLALSAPAFAALPVGAKAPAFELKGALGGTPLTFSLRHALHKGPVVLYFFPAAFTPGCTIEAHDFAEATDQFAKLGATVVGITAGNIDRVAEFSKVECRNKFTVIADPDAKIAAQYQSIMHFGDRTLSDRTSYVIAPDGTILMSYTDKNPDQHITKALEAVQQYDAAHTAAHRHG
jgi:thioredoxin-dependent peroxiredoxin